MKVYTVTNLVINNCTVAGDVDGFTVVVRHPGDDVKIVSLKLLLVMEYHDQLKIGLKPFKLV